MLEPRLNPVPASDLLRRLQEQHDEWRILRHHVDRTLRENARVRARVEDASARRNHRHLRPIAMPADDAD